ncbi:hypothetical protein [Afipia sp. Root123D2]|uniref:hypothetical protein n=1 Tax=Afipia sp. Root123D2 TaxID=1736436 RepID=UPI000AFABFFC|nr:hypothetical protein [Afipia sp. Root123D2]
MISPEFELSTPYIPSTTLRIRGVSGVPLDQIQTLFGAVLTAYNSVLLFDSITWQVAAMAHEFERFSPEFRYRSPRLLRRQFLSKIGFYYRQSQTEYFSPNEMVPAESQLVLRGATFNSPGFWEFFGKLNPLEVLRLYLNDRHERRKDKSYREGHENEKLRLENELRKNEIFSGKLRILREMGVTEEELSALKNRLLHKPLDALGSIQDREPISTAEFVSQDRQE